MIIDDIDDRQRSIIDDIDDRRQLLKTITTLTTLTNDNERKRLSMIIDNIDD